VLSGAEIIRLARCANAHLHYGGGPPQVLDAAMLGRIGHHYDLLVQLHFHDPIETGALVVCVISRGTDGGAIFTKCSTCTAAYLLSFMLLEADYQKVSAFSKAECAELADALRSGKWQQVAQLYRKKFRRSVA
jgi:hypothetical protein